MARKLSFLLVLVFLTSLSARAQDKFEIFGGYSFERASGARNLNGWEASGQYKFRNWLGGVADLDAHYGLPSHLDYRNVSFMVGPQISFPSRISPFAHVLVGIGHIRAGSSDSSLSTAIGGGVDLRLLPLISWRVIQGDDVVTRYFGGTQHNVRISTGIVFHF